MSKRVNKIITVQQVAVLAALQRMGRCGAKEPGMDCGLGLTASYSTMNLLSLKGLADVRQGKGAEITAKGRELLRRVAAICTGAETDLAAFPLS
jgi:DNA-binding MarR family transcriptional regulator